MHISTRSSGELVLPSVWPLLMLAVECLVNAAACIALCPVPTARASPPLWTWWCPEDKKQAFHFTVPISCLLLAAALSPAGMGFRQFPLLFAVAHLHTGWSHEHERIFKIRYHFLGILMRAIFLSHLLIHRPLIELLWWGRRYSRCRGDGSEDNRQSSSVACWDISLWCWWSPKYAQFYGIWNALKLTSIFMFTFTSICVSVTDTIAVFILKRTQQLFCFLR